MALSAAASCAALVFAARLALKIASLLEGLMTLVDPRGMRSASLNEVGKKASAPGARMERSALAGLRRTTPFGTP